MMKKLVSVLALGIAFIMILSSCSSNKGTDIGSLLNANAEYENDFVVLNNASEVNELADATFTSQHGNLLYFVGETTKSLETYTRHIVYDLENDCVVYDKSNSKKTDYTITFGEVDEFPFFVVNKVTYKLDSDSLREKVSEESTTLYDCLGNEVASATYSTSVASTGVTAISDIVYFEGKCYRADEKGKLSAAFDYSVLSAFPSGIDTKVNGKYYDFVTTGNKGVKIYDDSLKFVKEYEIPAYADLLSATFLKEDQLILQYVYELDEDAKDYSFIFEGEDTELVRGTDYEFKNMTKYNLETVIYNVEDGKAKEIKCPYVIYDTIMGVEDEETLKLLNEEAVQALIWVYEIVDERLKGDSVSAHTLGIDNKNKFFEIDEINGEAIFGIMQVGKDRWEIYTENFRYAFTKGAVIGQLRYNVSINDDMYYFNDRFFNMDLSQLYNCTENKMSVVGTLNGSFLLKNDKNELYLYDGSSLDKFVDEDDIEDGVIWKVLSADMFAIIDVAAKNPSCTIYNADGYEICEFDYNYAVPTIVAEAEGTVLVAYVDDNGDVSFHRFYN